MLEDKVLRMNKALAKYSDDIKQIEKELQGCRLNFPFTFKLNDECSLSFDEADNKVFRIIYQDKNMRRPFIQTPLAIRVEYADKINEFVYEFEKHIEKIIQKFEAVGK